MIPSPNKPPAAIRILRRDPNQSISPSNLVVAQPVSSLESSALEAGCVYESARAEIFAADGLDLSPNTGLPVTSDFSSKAKYRGHDNSAIDPDYCRVPVYCPASVYPTLNQVYGVPPP